jgi:hypothetical protein
MLWTDSLVGAHTHTERSSRTQIQTAFHKTGLEENLFTPSAVLVGAQWGVMNCGASMFQAAPDPHDLPIVGVN